MFFLCLSKNDITESPMRIAIRQTMGTMIENKEGRDILYLAFLWSLNRFKLSRDVSILTGSIYQNSTESVFQS